MLTFAMLMVVVTHIWAGIWLTGEMKTAKYLTRYTKMWWLGIAMVALNFAGAGVWFVNIFL